MKLTLKLLLWYLLSSLLATILSLALEPPHAHIPQLVVLAFFPVHPALWVREAVQGIISLSNALCLLLVVASIGAAAWHYRRNQTVEKA